ncbi:hypothetical protein AK88_05555, partial [Plasmodium fragile]
MERIEPRLDMYAISCEHAGWTRRGHTHQGNLYTGQTVGDVMKCRLMVGALLFASDWRNHMTHTKANLDNDKDMKAIMRCIVANVFAYILAEIPCGFQWLGPDQAWYIMRSMGDTGGVVNPISRGTCTLDEYKDTKVGTADLQGAVKNWLQQSTTISARINAIQKNPKCNIKWKIYKKEMEAKGEAEDSSSMFKEEDMQRLVKKQVQEVFTKIRNTVQKKVQRARNTTGGSRDLRDSDVDSADEEEEEQQNAQKDMKERTGAGGPAAPKPAATKPQAPASPEQAPASPPAGEDGKKGAKGEAGPTGPQEDPASGAAAAQAPDSKEPRQPGSSAVEDYKSICEHTDSAPQSTTVISSGASSVSITPVTYTYGAEAPCKFLQERAEQAERAKTTPKTVENTKNTKRDSAPSGDTNVHGDAVVDGGSPDDPPPLNPPKPKPNPNPEQTGRIGTGGDPGQAGKDGKSGEDGDPGNKAADQDEFS